MRNTVEMAGYEVIRENALMVLAVNDEGREITVYDDGDTYSMVARVFTCNVLESGMTTRGAKTNFIGDVSIQEVQEILGIGNVSVTGFDDELKEAVASEWE